MICIRLKEIGEVVQDLMSGLFQHIFTKKPISALTYDITDQILQKTVK